MSTVKSQFYKKFYFPDSSTACRTKLIAGTCFGSLARKRICGVLGSVSGKPSISCMPPAIHENGSQSGPTSSTSSPAANLLRRLRPAFPSSSQLSTTAQICQSRRYRELSVYYPGCPKKKPVE